MIIRNSKDWQLEWHPFFCVFPRRIDGCLVFLHHIERQGHDEEVILDHETCSTEVFRYWRYRLTQTKETPPVMEPLQ